MEYIPDFEKEAGITQEPWGLAQGELNQAAETGRDVAALRVRHAALTPADEEALTALYEETLALPAPAEWPHFESSELPDIIESLPTPGDIRPVERLEDRLHGAWAGRIIGNMMGKPFEIGPTRDSIRTYLQSIDSYPLTGYVPFADGADRSILGFWGFDGVTEGRIDGATRDDDIDYTVLGLHVLETYGLAYSRRDIAFEWLSRFPAYQVFTAERATYQNLIREVPLDEVGEYHNPFREWIGALIRADVFAFVYPGRPREAALLAFTDASLSHRANGIYGEMWAAALVSSAFTATSPEGSIVESLEHVPATSRIAEEVRTVLQDFRDGLTWDEAIDKLHGRFSAMSWVHTINNAGALTAAILWGAGDFGATVGLAVQAGLDTDSIGATAGAWAGAWVGHAGIPSALVDPLRDLYRSGVFGVGDVSISDLTKRTLALIDSVTRSPETD